MTEQRKNVISWDEYFISVARLTAQRSKDPSTQVGSCLVSTENKILSTGYNGFPRGCAYDTYPWDRDQKNPLDNKYPYVIHSEINCILNASDLSKVKGARLYTTHYPCNECAKVIVQVGIEKIIYETILYPKDLTYRAAAILFDVAGIQVVQFGKK